MTTTKDGKYGFNNDSGEEQADNELEVKPRDGKGYVGSNLDYATYQEFGTKKMAPNPYLRPAIESITTDHSTQAIINKTMTEHMLGALKKGQKRVTF